MNDRTERPWGWYEILHTEDTLQIKKIHINVGQRLSLQSHRFRSEHWFITAGIAHVELGDRSLTRRPGQSVDVKVEEKHRIGAGDEDVEFIEVQLGSYLGEDDITRYADDFGRA